MEAPDRHLVCELHPYAPLSSREEKKALRTWLRIASIRRVVRIPRAIDPGAGRSFLRLRPYRRPSNVSPQFDGLADELGLTP